MCMYIHMLQRLQIIRTLKVRFVRAPPTSTKPSKSNSCIADFNLCHWIDWIRNSSDFNHNFQLKDESEGSKKLNGRSKPRSFLILLLTLN